MKSAVKFLNLATTNKVLGIGPSTKETGTMTCGKGCHFIEKKERRVAFPHGFVLHVLVVHVASDPMDAGPAALAQGPIIAMKLATAISHHGSALRRGDNFTPWVDAVLQGHGAFKIRL